MANKTDLELDLIAHLKSPVLMAFLLNKSFCGFNVEPALAFTKALLPVLTLETPETFNLKAAILTMIEAQEKSRG